MTGASRLIPLLVVLAVGGCTQTDPYHRAGLWQPTGANSRNLATMVVNRGDLIKGRGSVGTTAVFAVPPVGRLWTGTSLALPNTSSQSLAAAPTAVAAGGSTPGAAP